MAGIPIVEVLYGGVPAVDTPNGSPVTVGTSGLPVTWVTSGGIPLNKGGGTPPPPSAPVNVSAPVVSGTGTVGQTLSTTNGSWTGSPAPTFTYQWQRNGVNIAGATSATYVLVSADGGTNVRCVVTATNGSGSASANSNAIAVASAYDSDAQAWFSAVVTNGGTDPDAATKQVVSDFYAGLKSDGLYALIDRMNLLAAHDSVGARLDLKDRATLLTPVGSPVFTAFRGYQGDGVGADINTNWDSVTPAGNFTQNSSGLTTYLNATASDVGSTAPSIGRASSVISFIRPRNPSNVIDGRVQSGGTTQHGTVASRLGFRSMSRTSADLLRAYGPDGLQSGPDATVGSTALVAENFRLLRLPGSFANDRIAFWASHSGFTASQTLNFRNRIVTMLTALGAN